MRTSLLISNWVGMWRFLRVKAMRYFCAQKSDFSQKETTTSTFNGRIPINCFQLFSNDSRRIEEQKCKSLNCKKKMPF